MKYTTLGKTGLTVSKLCLGTMTFGTSYYNIAQVEQPQATRMVERALETGVNFFDTADTYSQGESEKILGRALDDLDVDRESFVVATKVRGPMSQEAAEGTGDFNNIGLSRKHILEACEASLNRLGLNSIDLYQVHSWDPQTPVEETLAALNDLVRSGKVHYLGCSNWPARKISKALQISERKGWARFDALQHYYSLANRDVEHEILPICQEEGLGMLPWSPLSAGFLTGKYRPGGAEPEGARRVDFEFPPVDEEAGFRALSVMDEIASRTDATIPQIALAWLRDRPGVSSPIIGAKNMDQLEENLVAGDLELAADHRQRLDEVTRPSPQYPEWMIHFHQQGELPSGLQS